MNKLFYLTTAFLIIFTGCSSKQYYEPEDTLSFQEKTFEIESPIIDLNSDGATLEDNAFLTKKGTITNTKEDYRFLNFIDDTTLSSDLSANIHIKSESLDEVIKFNKNIVSASKKKNLLALGSVDNSIILYDIDTKQIVFKEYLKPSLINNVKIANPIFLQRVVLFPTLDGKIVIVDLLKNQIIKTINIDPKSDVNNIIFMKENADTLIAATSKKLFSFLNNRVHLKDVDVQSIIVKDNYIYVATLDGNIIKYDSSLNQLASHKFKFAKINALSFGTSLYALESQGFLINISEDFKDVKIFDFSFDEEEKVIAIDDKIYFEDEYIIIK